MGNEATMIPRRHETGINCHQLVPETRLGLLVVFLRIQADLCYSCYSCRGCWPLPETMVTLRGLKFLHHCMLVLFETDPMMHLDKVEKGNQIFKCQRSHKLH